MGTVPRRSWQPPRPLHELLLVKMGSGASYRVSSGGTQRQHGQRWPRPPSPTGRTSAPLCFLGHRNLALLTGSTLAAPPGPGNFYPSWLGLCLQRRVWQT